MREAMIPYPSLVWNKLTPDTNTGIQARIQRECHYSGGDVNYRQYIIAHGAVTDGPFDAGEEITGTDHADTQFTALIVLAGGTYLVVTLTGDTANTEHPRSSFLHPGDAITQTAGTHAGATADIDVTTGFAGEFIPASIGGGQSPIDASIVPTHYRDGNWSMPDAEEIEADGWSAASASGWGDAGNWSVAGIQTYSDWWMSYGELEIPVAGAISHSIVENTGGTTVIRVTRSSADATTWASNIILKDSGGTAVATVALAGNPAGDADGIILKNAAGATVTTVWSGQSGKNTPVYLEMFTIWIRIDWAAGEICVIAQPDTDQDFNKLSFKTLSTSAEYEWTGNQPAELSIEGVTASVRYTDIVIMDDPWLLIGDSLTVQMNRDEWGPQLATVLNRDNAVIDLSQGSSGYILNTTRSWEDMAVNQGLDKFRSPRLCIGALGINDIGAAETTADISTALSTMLTALDGGAGVGRLKQVIATEIPPSALAVASTAIPDLNAEIRAKVGNWSPTSRVADLYTLTAGPSIDEAYTVIKKRYRRTTDAGGANPRAVHNHDELANLHLSREGAMACVAEIAETVAPVI